MLSREAIRMPFMHLLTFHLSLLPSVMGLTDVRERERESRRLETERSPLNLKQDGVERGGDGSKVTRRVMYSVM